MSSTPWSPAEAEAKLAVLLDALDDSVTDLREISEAAARSRHRYELAEAKEFTKLRSTGVAIGEASKRALIACEEEHLDYLLTESRAKAAYKHIDVLKARADGLRSLLVSARGVSS